MADNDRTERLIAVIDMGTTNTRLTLMNPRGEAKSMARGAFGVKDRAASGDRQVLLDGLHGLLNQALDRLGLPPSAVELLISSGMITSEIGLKEIPHLIAPVSKEDLARNSQLVSMPEIGPAPVVFIPGIKNRVEGEGLEAWCQMDFMRGEETQVMGAMELYGIEAPASFIFLSSHTKLIDVDQKGRISRSFTTLSGQIFDALRNRSLLTSSLPREDPERLPLESLKQGVEAGLKYGLLRTGMIVRFMDVLVGSTPDERLAFLEGIVAASDLRAIKNGYPHMRSRVYLLGDRVRCQAYEQVLKAHLDSRAEYRYLGDESMDLSGQRGAFEIALLRNKLG